MYKIKADISRVLDLFFVWYDNELGYSNSLVDHVIKAGKLL
jgi:glyceraldehyde-3-phosphate dehydrogenase/erythrose-4-phosphate dehydrogenase